VYSQARAGCYEGLRQAQFETYYDLNVSWVFVLPVVLEGSSNSSTNMAHLQESEAFLAMPRYI
jgi:hypothetical protein